MMVSAPNSLMNFNRQYLWIGNGNKINRTLESKPSILWNRNCNNCVKRIVFHKYLIINGKPRRDQGKKRNRGDGEFETVNRLSLG